MDRNSPIRKAVMLKSMFITLSLQKVIFSLMGIFFFQKTQKSGESLFFEDLDLVEEKKIPLFFFLGFFLKKSKFANDKKKHTKKKDFLIFFRGKCQVNVYA